MTLLMGLVLVIYGAFVLALIRLLPWVSRLRTGHDDILGDASVRPRDSERGADFPHQGVFDQWLLHDDRAFSGGRQPQRRRRLAAQQYGRLTEATPPQGAQGFRTRKSRQPLVEHQDRHGLR